jgi:hypothetical protein
MTPPLDRALQGWLDRETTNLLVVVLRKLPEGLVYASTEIHADAWDLEPVSLVGAGLVDAVKRAENERVRHGDLST